MKLICFHIIKVAKISKLNLVFVLIGNPPMICSRTSEEKFYLGVVGGGFCGDCYTVKGVKSIKIITIVEFPMAISFTSFTSYILLFLGITYTRSHKVEHPINKIPQYYKRPIQS